MAGTATKVRGPREYWTVDLDAPGAGKPWRFHKDSLKDALDLVDAWKAAWKDEEVRHRIEHVRSYR